jgi:translation initiation factor 2 beta subunit (eIF-2beta)/eIF-5
MEQNNQLYLTSSEEVVNDMNYRYTISVIEILYAIKKGRQITIIDNINEFCDELLFDKELLVRILGKQLSCKSGLDKTTNKYYLQGKYTKEQVKDVVYSFIREYLLCVHCDKPEVDLKYRKEKIKQRCRACGNNVYLENGDESIIKIIKGVGK